MEKKLLGEELSGEELYTYEDYRLKAHGARTRQHRFQIKNKAKILFPDEYQERDFCLKRFQRMSYGELVEAHKVETESRENIRLQARKRPEYKEDDFPLRKRGRKQNNTIEKERT